MSEQKRTFMQELDTWSLEAVISPILDEGPDAIGGVQKSIREKVLESYKNGLRAPRRPTAPAMAVVRR